MLLYIVFTFIVTGLAIIDLALHQWFRYCYWDIGLAYADNDISGGPSESSFSGVHDDFCTGSLEPIIHSFCPDACGKLENEFKSAGIVMITFGAISLFFMAILIIMHIMLLCNTRIPFKSAWCTMFLPVIFYAIGFILYNVVGDFSGLKSTNNSSYKGGPDDFEWGAGMILAVVVLVLMAGNLLFGLIFTRRYLIPY